MSTIVHGLKCAFLLVGTLWVLDSCTPRNQAAAARAAYLAELQACVVKSPTVEESGACRRAVKTRWGVE